MNLAEYRYRTITGVRSQLFFLEKVHRARMGEIVQVVFPDGRRLDGEVLKIERDTVLVQIFGDCSGMDTDRTTVILGGNLKRAPLSLRMLNRVFDGSFRPLDSRPPFVPEQWRPATGFPMNPTMRDRPRDFIETGVSAIDGLNTLVKGQKLPVFSCAGLPAGELVARILRDSRMRGSEAGFAVVFVALGLTHHEYSFYMRTLEEMSTSFVAFINLAEDSVVERLLAPRFGLTAAEFLAFEKGMDVLVIIADITNYCDGLRELSMAREELPGRRGYPGYMYSDLASLFERAGRIIGRPGSVTMLPVITMPEDDITHPIPDLTGYITEGQIVLSRELHRQGIFPPVDVLPSLSRLMQKGIGKSMTREDHREIANRLYATYARGVDLRGLEAIVGREGLSAEDRVVLDFAASFEREFVHQEERRSIAETLQTGEELLNKCEAGVREAREAREEER
ncbi:MAG: ATP synthase subunit B [Desulfobulbaceae bacterium]